MTEQQSGGAGAAAAAAATAAADAVPRQGWYEDKSQPGFLRLWDGSDWTNKRIAKDERLERELQDARIQFWGIVLAILVPPVGFVMGGILAARGRRAGMGAFIMVLSLALMYLYTQLYVSWVVDNVTDDFNESFNDSFDNFDSGATGSTTIP